jgi:hypothetical protein
MERETEIVMMGRPLCSRYAWHRRTLIDHVLWLFFCTLFEIHVEFYAQYYRDRPS